MPIKEQVTGQEVINAVEPQAIAADGTVTGAIIDTKDYDMGLYFALLVTGYTDGTYTLYLEDGDDSGLSDAAVLSSTQLVYGSLPALSAALSEGDGMPREGVHSTKRYLRASIVATGVTTGVDIAQVVAVAGSELLPTSQT